MRDREKGTAVDYVGHFEREAASLRPATTGPGWGSPGSGRAGCLPAARPGRIRCRPGCWTGSGSGRPGGAGGAGGQDDGQDQGRPGIEISGTASDLALFLWQRPVAGRLDVQGDKSMLGRYFTLVPPV
jgi:hypothetical protein